MIVTAAATLATDRALHVRYIDRTRDYYAAQGFEKPYRWAAFDDVPFAPLRKSLAESTAVLITTANEWHGGVSGPDRPRRRVHSFSSTEPPPLFTDDLSWHKTATHLNDLDSYLPVHRLAVAVRDRRLGALAPRCHGVPTEYSQRRTREHDAPEILRRCREDGVDVALLVPL